MAISKRKPDYILKSYNIEKGTGNRVGAGWQNSQGAIGIILDDFVVLEQREGWSFILFENKEKE